MFNVTHSERSPTMTTTKDKPAAAAIKDLLSHNPDGLREIVRAVMQEILEAEMTDALQAEKGERTAARLGYRSGYYYPGYGRGYGGGGGGHGGHLQRDHQC